MIRRKQCKTSIGRCEYVAQAERGYTWGTPCSTPPGLLPGPAFEGALTTTVNCESTVRTYGGDFDAETVERISEWLSTPRKTMQKGNAG